MQSTLGDITNKKIMENFPIYFLCTVLLIFHEIHFEEFFAPHASIVALFNIIALAVFSILIIIFHKKSLIKPDLFPLIIYGLAVIYGLLMLFIRSLYKFETIEITDILRLPVYLTVVLIVLYLMTQKTTENALKYITKILVIFAVINIPIIIFDNFLLWGKIYMRAASVLDHPNVAGFLFGFGLIFTLLTPTDNKYYKYFAVIILAISVFFSYSRGSITALIFSLLFYTMIKKPLSFAIIIIPLLVLITIYINPVFSLISDKFPLFHTASGLNERDIMWMEALRKLSENPFLGHSQSEMRLLIADIMPKGYQSFHNAYIDSAFLMGIPFVILILFLTLISIIKTIKRRPEISCCIIYVALNAATLSTAAGFSPLIVGTLGIQAFIMTLLVLYPYQQKELEHKK